MNDPSPEGFQGQVFCDEAAVFPSWEGQGVDKKGSYKRETPEPTPNPSQEGNLATSPRKNLPLKGD